MNGKQALIVDDSKTAQYLLKRMLQSYDLVIDVVSSAEEALTYLSYNQPAVIFLDQQMTGMTGMEALKTIKANPHTALIPVIMYTSQNDDLFVSQAIALGAQGILSKSALQPSNLQQVLARLNFRMRSERDADVDADEESVIAPDKAADLARPRGTRAGTAVNPAAPDLDKVQLQIGRLFEMHIADVRTQINNSTQFIVRRMSTSLEKTASRDASAGSNSLAMVKSAVAAAVAAERLKKTTAVRWMAGSMLAAVMLFGYFLLQFQADADAASQKLLAALEANKAQPPRMAAAVTSVLSADKAGVPAKVHPALLQAISWAQNTDFHFDFGEQPLSGMRLSNLHQLIYLLAEGGYRGPLVVNINFGNFCLEPDETNMLRPARSDVRASTCKMQKDMNPRFMVNDYVTLQYQAFEKSLAPLQDGRISIRLVTNGMSTPRVDYPALSANTSAGEWNRAAHRNNRISVQFPN